MKRKFAVAAAVAATLLAAACGSSDDGGATPNANASVNGAGKTLKVWLMVDAESAWPEVVQAANEKFKADTKADVKVEYQQWANHLTKLDATLAGSDVPDVIELGNTEAPKYVSARLADLDSPSRPRPTLTVCPRPASEARLTSCPTTWRTVLIYNTDCSRSRPRGAETTRRAGRRTSLGPTRAQFNAYYCRPLQYAGLVGCRLRRRDRQAGGREVVARVRPAATGPHHVCRPGGRTRS